jgi:hypothetical protein
VGSNPTLSAIAPDGGKLKMEKLKIEKESRLSRFSILTSPSRLLNPQSFNPQFSILNSQFSILNSQFSILNSQSSILNPQSSILNPQSSILNPQSSILNSTNEYPA